MISTTFALAMLLQQATTPADLPPAPAAARDSSEAELKRIYVKDSDAATRVEVEDPMQEICVRKLVVGSRVKARTVCQDQTSWKAYVLAREATVDDWADEGKGLNLE